MANGFLQAVVTGKHPQCPREGEFTRRPSEDHEEKMVSKDVTSNGAFLYSYGIEQAPLGQVVNILDNHNVHDKHAENDGQSTVPGSNDNSVQVMF